MTAVTDLTTVLTILKGSTPTAAQIGAVVALYDVQGSNEQKAAAVLNLWRQDIRKRLRTAAEKVVYSAALAVAHYPADQPALLAAARPNAQAAGVSAEASL